MANYAQTQEIGFNIENHKKNFPFWVETFVKTYKSSVIGFNLVFMSRDNLPSYAE